MSLESVVSRPRQNVVLMELRGRLLFGDQLQQLKAQLASLAVELKVLLVLDLSNVEYADFHSKYIISTKQNPLTPV